jgi:hypothetical protein
MTPPTEDPSAREIVELLQQLGSHMHAVGTRFAARESLHGTDVQALSALAMAGGHLGAGELARSLELTSGATTRLIDRLERVGHVARTTDPATAAGAWSPSPPRLRRRPGPTSAAIAATIAAALEPYGPRNARSCGAS